MLEMCIRLRKAAGVQVELGAVAHEQDQDQSAVKHRQEWEKNVAEKQRMDKMQDAKDTFVQQIMSRRAAEFEALRVRSCAAQNGHMILAAATCLISRRTSCCLHAFCPA